MSGAIEENHAHAANEEAQRIRLGAANEEGQWESDVRGEEVMSRWSEGKRAEDWQKRSR